MKSLVIIPAYNEAKNIKNLINQLKIIDNFNFDIIIINDCSDDDTSTICKELNIKVIDLPCNLGIGGAVQTGYKYADENGYDIAIQVDGDGQHRPEYLNDIIQPILQEKADMVIGSRYLEKQGFQSTFLRRLGIKYFSRLIELLTQQKITDPTSGFRAGNKKVIKLFSQRYPVDYPEPEAIIILSRNNLKVLEVPVIMSERREGTSSINWIRSIYYMIKVTLAILIDIFRKKTPVNQLGDS
ncbi:glycosyltransferase family 2 protein [Paenibacillus sp. 32O-W]|uniref:glycosyltransferase family 2 protein n=1 Tax=Paenibacillus sp. 32O-W TaxID=1695218 RepID=UPI0011AAC82A